MSTGSNIKSSSVKNDVMSALKSIQQNIKNIKTIGPNGLIILSGIYDVDYKLNIETEIDTQIKSYI